LPPGGSSTVHIYTQTVHRTTQNKQYIEQQQKINNNNNNNNNIFANTQIAKELKLTPILDRLLEYKRNWIPHVNRMSRNRLPRVMKHYCRTGRRNHGRPLKRLLDT
jgi:hypothetical protein